MSPLPPARHHRPTPLRQLPEPAADSDDPKDRKLAECLRSGEERALEQIYGRWSPRVHGRALRQLKDDGEAQDVTQAVFAAVWQGRTGYRPEDGPLSAWIAGITRHKIADAWVRRERRRRELLAAGIVWLRPGGVDPEPADEVAGRLSVLAELAVLGEPQRTILCLALFADLTHTDRFAARASARNGEKPSAAQSAANETDEGGDTWTTVTRRRWRSPRSARPPWTARTPSTCSAAHAAPRNWRSCARRCGWPSARIPTGRTRRPRIPPTGCGPRCPLSWACPAGSSSGPGPSKPSSGRRRWALIAAAALIAACSGLAGAAVRGGDQPTQAPPGQLVAQASLGALRSDSTGSARWIDAPGGAVLEVQVSADELASAVGYLEVWLLDPDSNRLVSLGLLPPSARSGETATLPVPAGIDPGDYAFVDVSDEPLDGDPSHSGVSLARGDLRPAA